MENNIDHKILRLKKVFEYPYHNIKKLLTNDNILYRYTKTEYANHEHIILEL